MEYKLSASYERMRGFYSLPKNTLDIVFMGTSHMYYGIIPMKLWEDYGITSYVMAQQRQRVECLYYYIKEVLKYQSPKLIVIDVLSLVWRGIGTDISIVHKSIDYMKWGNNKLNLIEEIVKDEKMYEYFNNYLHHDTSKYVETTYKNMYNNNELVTGDLYSILIKIKGKMLEYCYNIKKTKKNKKPRKITGKLGNKRKLYLMKIIKELKDNNIELCFVNMPYLLSSDHWGKLEELDKLFEQHNMHFLDLNRHYNNLNINLETDFWDDTHVNYLGAQKVTKYIGEYIMNSYDIKFKDKRNDALYKVWNDYNIKYKEINENIMERIFVKMKDEKITNYQFEENFDHYIKNNIDIRLVYSKIIVNNSYIDIELIKLENEKKYSMQLNYNLVYKEYVIIMRRLFNRKVRNWSNKKGIEIVLIPDNSNRDFSVQVIAMDGWWGQKIYKLKGNSEEKIKVLFEELENPTDGKNRIDAYKDISFLGFGIGQGEGLSGRGSVIIKSIKLF